jgi:peptidoglycan hydrolase-like protein with peptidoglycan-binding domain
MSLKRIATLGLAATLTVAPVQRALADSDALAGAIVGAVIGGIVVNEANKAKQRKAAASRTTTRSTSSGVSAATREKNREMQTALNYFGFNVGTPDGAVGPRTRAAISEYQLTMGWPPTGNMSDFERDILVSSYYRAQSGGASTAALIAANPRGAKGVLMAWKDERLGTAAPVQPMPIQPAGGAGLMAGGAALGAAGATFAGTAGGGATLPTPQLPSFAAAAPEPAGAALPSFLGGGATQVSLNAHCSQVAAQTGANGGYVTQLTMTDAAFALSEQFCLARTYAMTQSEQMVAQVQGFTPQQIADQCQGLVPPLKDQVAAVSVQPKAQVADAVQGFVLTAGMPPAQLAGTAKVCLGIGYKTDNMDLSLASALILGVVGERSYSELVGHHLAQGFGVAQRPDLALAWYDAALGAPGEQVVQIFAPQMVDRAGLIRMAAYGVAGQPLPGGTVPQPAAIQPLVPAPMPAAQAQGGGFALPKLPFVGGN